MIVLIKLIVLTSVWILGLTIVTSKGMIFYSWREKADASGKLIFEPIITCEWCMPSIHTIFGFAFAFLIGVIPFEFKLSYIFMYPIVAMGSSIVCGLTWTTYKTLAIVLKHYTNLEQLSHFEVKDRIERYNTRRNNSSSKNYNNAKS